LIPFLLYPMPTQSSKEALSLESQYYDMKRSLYRKFIKYLTIIVILIMLFEAVRALLEQSIAKAIRLPIPLLFTFITNRYLRNPHQKFEVLCVFITFVWNTSSLLNNIHNIEGYIKNPLDAYYYGCVSIFLERLCVEKIPNGKHRLFFGILITLARLIICTPSTGVLLRHISMSGLSIFLDLDKEKLMKNMFFSYNNYKNQLSKFKDLVVQDIPESIAILSNTLAKSLFLNETFKSQTGSLEMLQVREYLNKLFIIQDSEEIDELTNDTQKTSLLQFLQRQFGNNNHQAQDDQKYTFNVVYKKPKSPFLQRNLLMLNTNEEDFLEEQIFEVKAFALTWDNESAIAIIMHDITQQQTIMGLQMADAQKDMVLATVSHELRTPLNGILGMIQVMQKSEKDQKTLQCLEICKNSSDLLMGLVNSILDLNLIRSNKIRLSPQKVSLHELLKDIVHMFEFQCKQKEIYIKLEISKFCPEVLFTDKNRLTQIFINLVGNALKFTFEGGITISAHEDARNHVKFLIKDTGIGIKETEQEKLFHMFGRISENHNKLTNNQGGVGFGLTISHSLVKLLNGITAAKDPQNKQYIKTQSVYGTGSTFEFSIRTRLENELENENIGEISREFASMEEVEYHIEKIEGYPTISVNNFSILKLPHPSSTTYFPSTEVFFRHPKSLTNTRKSASFNPLTLQKKSALFSAGSDCSGCVLLVDDNPFNLVVAEQLVSSHGYKVKTALSGPLALRSVVDNLGSHEAIKLIFMDIQMPVMDGYETTKQLKKLMEEGKIEEIPIVALTANDSIADKDKCIKAGMSGHLSKPLKDQDLKMILNKYL